MEFTEQTGEILVWMAGSVAVAFVVIFVGEFVYELMAMLTKRRGR